MARSVEISAGLLAFRRRSEIEILLAHPGGPYWARKDDGAWTIPKGLVRPDDLLEGAKREFREETSFEPHGPFIPLQPVRQRSGKTVYGFAFEGDFDPESFSSNLFEMEWPPRTGKRAKFPEIDRLGWFGPNEAAKKIIAYPRPFLEELAEKIAEMKAPPDAARREAESRGSSEPR